MSKHNPSADPTEIDEELLLKEVQDRLAILESSFPPGVLQMGYDDYEE